MKRDVLADLYDSMTHNPLLTPTGLQFFQPTLVFWDAMRAYKDRLVFELGAGRGDTVREAKDRGYRWGGCDVRASIEQSLQGIHRISALSIPLAKGMAVIACRPDHSGWVLPALRRALDYGIPALYVSKPDNHARDIGDALSDYGYAMRTPLVGVGAEGEWLWEYAP